MLPPRCPGDATPLPASLPHSPASSSSPRNTLPLLCSPHPNGAAATDESHRGYRPPHGSPTPQEAPPVLPLPPQRATRPRTCHNTALDAFFNLGTAGHLRQIRRLRTIPSLVSASNGSAVSLRCLSCARPLRSRPLAPSPTEPESSSPPATRSPRLEAPHVASEHAVVLVAFPGTQSTYPLLLPCPKTPCPSVPELRPPHSSPPASIPTAPSSSPSTKSLSPSPAPRRYPPRPFWWPEQRIALAPPRRARRRLNASAR